VNEKSDWIKVRLWIKSQTGGGGKFRLGLKTSHWGGKRRPRKSQTGEEIQTEMKSQTGEETQTVGKSDWGDKVILGRETQNKEKSDWGAKIRLSKSQTREEKSDLRESQTVGGNSDQGKVSLEAK
jgi:hypothetical protein